MRKTGVCIKIRNLCTNNSVEALLPFNEGHQVLLKLLCIFSTWGGCSSMGKKRGLCYVALLQGSTVSPELLEDTICFGKGCGGVWNL